jgi:predicted metalloprotease with PDZ domain
VGQVIRYEVDLTDRAHHLVRVRLVVPPDLAPGGRVVLPVWTPGSYVVRDYVRHVQWITARNDQGEEVALRPDGRTAWRVPSDVAGPVEIELELFANELTVRTNHVDDHHALLVAAATFPYVEGGEDRDHVVHLPAGEDQRVWSLLPPGDAPDTYVAAGRDHLVDGAFEVGDLPAVGYEVAGVPHTFVWAGHGGHPDLDAIARDAAAIGEQGVALFGGALPIDRYTFLCLGWDRGGGGLEHRDGAVLQVPVHTFQDEDGLARFQGLLAHEYLHLWNVKRLTPSALVRPDLERPTHSESLWVAEGWTAYYDDLLPVRAGLWTLRRMLDVLRDVLRRTRDTPGARLQPLRRASYEAWTKHYVRDENTPNAATDYYNHGGLVAWYLDLLLRREDPDGDGLDEVLRLLWTRFAGSPDGYHERDVEEAVAEVAGRDLREVFDRHVDGAELPPIAELLPAVGLQEVAETGPVAPDLGVEVSEDAQGIVFAVALRDRPAWRAGITGGDRLVALDRQTVLPGQLGSTLRAFEAGDAVEVTVTRGPRLLTHTVTLGEPRPGTRLEPLESADDRQRTAFRRWTGRTLDEI